MTVIKRETFILNNNLKMPSVGLGVLFAKNNGEVENAILTALENGYRKIDTASGYGNEQGVGKSIKESTIARNEIFLTTKVWNTEQGHDETLFAFDQSKLKAFADRLFGPLSDTLASTKQEISRYI